MRFFLFFLPPLPGLLWPRYFRHPSLLSCQKHGFQSLPIHLDRPRTTFPKIVPGPLPRLNILFYHPCGSGHGVDDAVQSGRRAGRVNTVTVPLSLPSDGTGRGWFLAAAVPTEGWYARSTNGGDRLCCLQHPAPTNDSLAVSVL